MNKIWLAFAILAQLFVVGCATPAWNKYPIKVQPDYNCFYGGPEGGTSYYIWKCLDGKRVVIKQSGFGFWTASAKRYESSCDGKTKIENEQDLDSGQQQCQRKDRYRWETEPQPQK